MLGNEELRSIKVNKRACIIIPIYNENPTESEVMSISRNTSVLCDYDIYAVHPESMSLQKYKDYGFTQFVAFSDNYFKSNKSYSRLILSEEFYQPFMEYEYMLIAQTDTLILNTEYTLDQFMDKGYDYWGAPWPNGPFDEPYGLREWFKSIFVHKPHDLHVGNGGFTLRKVATSYELVKKHKIYIKYLWKFNEDLFFSTRARAGEMVSHTLDMEKTADAKHAKYTSAPASEATQFALETNMQVEIDKGNIPYAVHAWEKHYRGDITKLITPYEK